MHPPYCMFLESEFWRLQVCGLARVFYGLRKLPENYRKTQNSREIDKFDFNMFFYCKTSIRSPSSMSKSAGVDSRDITSPSNVNLAFFASSFHSEMHLSINLAKAAF